MWTIFALLCLAKISSAFLVEVDVNSEECFFDRASVGQRVTLVYEVAEGGFYDIDVIVCFAFCPSYRQIYAPNGNVLHHFPKKSDDKFSFKAELDGEYRYCFSNKMSSMTPKFVLFEMELAENHLKFNDDDEGIELFLLTFKFCRVYQKISWYDE